jgi:hypothetical protein
MRLIQRCCAHVQKLGKIRLANKTD